MTQPSREALIELLFLSLYLDNHLSIAEDSALESALANLGWDSPRPKEIFILNAFAKARKAADCPANTTEFLAERVKILKSDDQGTVAMEWLGKVLAADGMSAEEDRFLSRVHALLS